VSGIGEEGALLMRPDQHVAWRTSSARARTHEGPARALARILAQP